MGELLSVWFDEAAKLDPTSFAVKRIVRPQQITCRYCGAQPGQQCQRWRRTKRGKVKQNRDSPHPDRRHDAKLATTALNALTRR